MKQGVKDVKKIKRIGKNKYEKGKFTMKGSKLFSVMAAASVAVTMFAGFALSANAAGGAWVGYSTDDSIAEWNYGVGDERTTTSTGTYDPTTGTLTFTENTTLCGCENDNKSYYGNSIISVGNTDLTLDLNSCNVTLDSTNLNEIEGGGYDYIYGLYKVGGTLTIQGPGTLNIIASGGLKESVALRAHAGANIKITGNAQVNVTDNDDNGYGLFAAGNVDVIDGSLTMMGGAAALDFASNDTANIDIFHKQITAGESAVNATTWTVTDAGESAKELEQYKYVKIESTKAPATSVMVGGTTLKDGQTYTNTNDDVTAVYDSWTSTLNLSGSGTINGLTEDTLGAYGAAIWATDDITIDVDDDADITLQGGTSANNSYSYGIYSSSGTLTITGGGKLTVQSTDIQTTYPSAAVYTGDNITISGSVKVTANGLGSNHLAVNNTKESGTITIPDGSIAELHMTNTGSEMALFNGSLVYPDGYLANAIDKNDEDIQLGSPAVQYSEYHIKPNLLSDISKTDNIGAFKGDNADGTENDEDAATAFLTTITPKGSVTISALSWTVTSQGKSQTLFPKNFATLELNSEAKIGVIVKGLYDENASAEAYVYGSVDNAAN